MRFRTFSTAVALLSATLPLSHQTDHSGDPCAEIAQRWAKADYSVNFPAELAQACLKSIPYDGERARFILEQLKLYFQFFSAQAYHKSPPPFFEVLPVDTNNTFQYFDSQIDGGVYKNNLEFDHDLMSFFGSYRHSAMEYMPACSGAFIFRNDHPLFAMAPEKSTDDPRIYVVLDPYGIPRLGPEVETINGEPVVDYLHKLTQKLPGLKYIDPDARWNDLFFHRSNSDARLGAFAQRFTYPEGEQIVLKYKNAHEVTVRWTAEVFKGVAELTTDGVHLPWTDQASFLQKVCLRPMDPATCKTQDGLYTVHKRGLHTKRDQPPTSMWGYPAPVLHTHGHELSLFEYDQYSVLAISSFDPHPGNEQDGMAFIYDFQQIFYEALQSIKDKDQKLGKKRKLLIDLSHNDGGRQLLAHEAARMLLPDADHYFLTNRRWSPALYDLMTAGFQENHASVFNFRYFVDENGKDFKDAKDILGPVCHDDDCFTKLMQSDHEQIVNEVWGQDYDAPKDSYWKPEDLVVVADGLCNGACAILLEALQSQNVKVAAYGGRPGHKMQGAGGLKGHSPASFTKIDEEIYYILGAGAWDNVNMPKPLPIQMLWGSVGLENRFRKGESSPMEFVHHQATWTHKFTKAMFEGAQAIWDDAYTLASTNTPADADEGNADSEKKGSIGNTKDQLQPQLSGTSNPDNSDLLNSPNNAIDDFMTWHLGKYVYEFFHAFHPEELFKVKDLQKENELKNTQKKEDETEEKEDKVEEDEEEEEEEGGDEDENDGIEQKDTSATTDDDFDTADDDEDFEEED